MAASASERLQHCCAWAPRPGQCLVTQTPARGEEQGAGASMPDWVRAEHLQEAWRVWLAATEDGDKGNVKTTISINHSYQLL